MFWKKDPQQTLALQTRVVGRSYPVEANLSIRCEGWDLQASTVGAVTPAVKAACYGFAVKGAFAERNAAVWAYVAYRQ